MKSQSRKGLRSRIYEETEKSSLEVRTDLFYWDCLFSRESISIIESIVAKNGNESTDCKLFQLDHNDISCEIFDIVSSSEICNGSLVSTSMINYYYQ